MLKFSWNLARRYRASRFLTLCPLTLRQIVTSFLVTAIVIFVIVTVEQGPSFSLWLDKWIIAWPTAFAVVRWIVPWAVKKLGLG